MTQFIRNLKDHELASASCTLIYLSLSPESIQRTDAECVNMSIAPLQSHAKLHGEENNTMPFQQALWKVLAIIP